MTRAWLLRLAKALDRLDAKFGVSSWLRRRQRINPSKPGHSLLERFRALNDEMVLIRKG
jgi:hypothetical protein